MSLQELFVSQTVLVPVGPPLSQWKDHTETFLTKGTVELSGSVLTLRAECLENHSFLGERTLKGNTSATHFFSL